MHSILQKRVSARYGIETHTALLRFQAFFPHGVGCEGMQWPGQSADLAVMSQYPEDS
jgi:hypothetical protein